MGDVLRTTPLLTALKKKCPKSSITWLVDSSCAAILQDNPIINHLVSYSAKNLRHLQNERFDWAVNLDKDQEALEAIEAISADKKMGFGRSIEGKVCALDPLSDYALRLGIDDDLKFLKNKKTYQEISFEQMGIKFNGEEYLFCIDKKEARAAEAHLKKLGVDLKNKNRVIVGINTGAGSRFAGKKLPVATLVQLADKFYNELHATVFLLGGKDESERNRRIEEMSASPVVNTGSHSIQRFAAIVRACDVVVSGDTTAMHIAIAVKVPVVAYFASTCAQEIEMYGRGRKIVSEISCAPCYKKICPIDEQCMKDMSVDRIFEETRALLALPR